ncbi:MAG: hypothetical protein DRI24_08375 [Deltaproteobacteria bacterium]|nr:MAG: hypothetical protein DRI24_08375 [Deltaproteobacteria bacterium]
MPVTSKEVEEARVVVAKKNNLSTKRLHHIGNTPCAWKNEGAALVVFQDKVTGTSMSTKINWEEVE